MTNRKTELLIIGGGPAGMSAALAANKEGCKDILLIEREFELGGILKQCIHNGFGLHYFNEELTGPEYAMRLIDEVEKSNIEVMLNTMAIDISSDRNVIAANTKDGVFVIEAKRIVLAMGCRERTRGAIMIPGDRPSGVLTAGSAQKLVNIHGKMVGKEVVILGSGDIGLIMARRMTLEGASVKMVLELQPYSAGLKRNIQQCLNDFDIPLYLSHTVTRIIGKERLEAIEFAKVDENFNVIEETRQIIECDTLLLSVGLIPENDLVNQKDMLMLDSKTKGVFVDQYRETDIPGIYSCGNVLHVHDLVDYVSNEASIAGKNAIIGQNSKSEKVKIDSKEGLIYCIPQYIKIEGENTPVDIYFRAKNVYSQCVVVVFKNGAEIFRKKYKKIVPAEMQSVHVLFNNLNKNDNLQIKLIQE